jgi:hypothetical protein
MLPGNTVAGATREQFTKALWPTTVISNLIEINPTIRVIVVMAASVSGMLKVNTFGSYTYINIILYV